MFYNESTATQQKRKHRNRVAPRSGPPMTLDQLPPADTKRWVASRKAAVVGAISQNLLTRGEAKVRYGISEAELGHWEIAIESAGTRGLRVTHLQRYRAIIGDIDQPTCIEGSRI
jgi:hypothetical protein